MRKWLTLTLTLTLTPVARAETVRWVVSVGVNDGGPDKVVLRHADDDAAAFARVLAELGGVPPARVVLLEDADTSRIHDTLARVGGYLREARARGDDPELLFYYSGHADERGLRPHGEVLPWTELRRALSALDADVRVAVVDACASGAIVRRKGGIAAPGFLDDTSHAVTGEAYLTSSSADEASQESDRLGGSYFTHHLVSALRGAADEDLDARVSLSEVYRYVYAQTVRGTEGSWGGAQHPSQDLDLSGRGEVVLTDLRERTAALQLGVALDGLLSIRDEQGRLVAELFKTVGVPTTYALPPGRYELRLRAREQQFRATVDVARGQALAVEGATFRRDTELELTRARGSAPWTDSRPFVFHLTPFLGTNGFRRDLRLAGFGLDVLGALHPAMEGAHLGLWTAIAGNADGALLEGASVVRGRLRGTQIGVVGVAGQVAGAQLNLVNVSRGDADGVQIGAVNVVEGTQRGLQWGAFANVVRGRSAEGQVGWQLSLYNRAAVGQKGVQMGFVNDSQRLRGFQLGVVNVARDVRGLQLGLVNVADDVRGESIGLINIIRSGYHALELWTDDVATVNLGIKSGSKHVYSLWTLGFDAGTDPIDFTYGVGLGGHVTHKRFLFDVDLLLRLDPRPAVLTFGALPASGIGSLRPSFGVDLGKGFGLQAGPTGNIGFAFSAAEPEPPIDTFMPTLRVGETAPGPVRLWLGFQAGLRWTF